MLKAQRGFTIYFFVGTPLKKSDLERVGAGDASMVFILADFQSSSTVSLPFLCAPRVTENSFATLNNKVRI